MIGKLLDGILYTASGLTIALIIAFATVGIQKLLKEKGGETTMPNQEPIMTLGLTEAELELIPAEVIKNFWALINAMDAGIGTDIEDFGPWLIMYYNGWLAKGSGLKQLDLFSGE